MWTSSARALAATLLATLALTGCGDDTATDAGGDDPADTPSSEPVTPSPTDAPATGRYPEFAPDDYEYTLLVTCFCPDAGVPIRVTVQGGELTEAVYGRGGRGFGEGDPVPDQRARTINDIIAELNGSADAASVRVEWPEGQDFPSEVYIDKSKRIVDEEIGYTITDVDVD